MKKWIAIVCVFLVVAQLLTVVVVVLGVLMLGPRRPHDPTGFLARLERDAQGSGEMLTDGDVGNYFWKPSSVYSNIHERRPGVPEYFISDYRGDKFFRIYKAEGQSGIVAVEYAGSKDGVPEFMVFVYQPDIYEIIRADLERRIGRPD